MCLIISIVGVLIGIFLIIAGLPQNDNNGGNTLAGIILVVLSVVLFVSWFFTRFQKKAVPTPIILGDQEVDTTSTPKRDAKDERKFNQTNVDLPLNWQQKSSNALKWVAGQAALTAEDHPNEWQNPTPLGAAIRYKPESATWEVRYQYSVEENPRIQSLANAEAAAEWMWKMWCRTLLPKKGFVSPDEAYDFVDNLNRMADMGQG